MFCAWKSHLTTQGHVCLELTFPIFTDAMLANRLEDSPVLPQKTIACHGQKHDGLVRRSRHPLYASENMWTFPQHISDHLTRSSCETSYRHVHSSSAIVPMVNHLGSILSLPTTIQNVTFYCHMRSVRGRLWRSWPVQILGFTKLQVRQVPSEFPLAICRWNY